MGGIKQIYNEISNKKTRQNLLPESRKLKRLKIIAEIDLMRNKIIRSQTVERISQNKSNCRMSIIKGLTNSNPLAGVTFGTL